MDFVSSIARPSMVTGSEGSLPQKNIIKLLSNFICKLFIRIGIFSPACRFIEDVEKG